MQTLTVAQTQQWVKGLGKFGGQTATRIVKFMQTVEAATDANPAMIKDIHSLDGKVHLAMTAKNLELRVFITRNLLGANIRTEELIYIVPVTKVHSFDDVFKHILKKVGEIHAAYKSNLPTAGWIEGVLNAPAVQVINTKRTINQKENVVVMTRVLPDRVEITTTHKHPDPMQWRQEHETLMLAV